MSIHDPWTQLHIFSASESEGQSNTFLCVCFPVPGGIAGLSLDLVMVDYDMMHHLAH